jgi:hypothetical protein
MASNPGEKAIALGRVAEIVEAYFKGPGILESRT